MYQACGKIFNAIAINQVMIRRLGRYAQKLACIAPLVALFLVSTPTQADVVNLYTGDASYSVPIVSPPGSNGMGPNLSLEYSSGAGNDWLGQGWSLKGLGYIERRGPNYRPSPTYTTDDTYILVLGGSSFKLINGSEPSGYQDSRYYRTNIESFMRIFFDSVANTWLVTDKSGNYYSFQTTQSPNTGNTTAVYRWYLNSVIGNNDIFWAVSYQGGSTPGSIFPKQIVYSTGNGLSCSPAVLTNCRVINFATEWRTDYTQTYEKGGLVTLYDRIKSIEIKMGNQLVRKYSLGYTMRESTARGYAPVSQLTSVTETAADGVTTLPATTFTYNVDANGSNLALTQTSMGTSPTEAIAGCTYSIDINDDGFADTVVGQAGAWYYYPNQGGTNYGARINIDNPQIGLPSLCATNTQFYRYLSKQRNYLQGTITYTVKQREETHPVNNTALIDLDGDGVSDILYSPGVGQWYWWRNQSLTGGAVSFANQALIVSGPANIQLNDPSIRLADMDGDGLVDLVQFTRAPDPSTTSDNDNIHSRSRWNIIWWRNLGVSNGTLSFNSPPTAINGIILYHSYPDNSTLCSDGGLYCIDRVNFANFMTLTGTSGLSLIDMNGDGLPDLVWESVVNPPAGVALVNATDYINYYPNVGGGTSLGPRTTLTGPNGAGIPLPNTALQVEYSPLVLIPLVFPEHLVFTDVNNDGLVDILVGSANAYYYIPQQPNYKFGTAVPLGNSPPVNMTRGNSIALTDVNGDGFVDFLHGISGNYASYTLDTSDSHQNLDTVRNQLGGVITFSYSNLRSDNSTRWVTSSITQNDGVGVDSTTRYFYYGGKSIGWPYNEFRGYATTTAFDPVGNYTSTYFNQDDAQQGTVASIFTNNNLNKYQKGIFKTYNVTTPVAGVSRVDLQSVQEDTVDGSTIAASIRTDYANYDQYGNPRQVTTSGTNISPRVVTTDYVYNTSTYAYPGTFYIIDRPYHTQTTVNGSKIAESWFDYDNRPNGTVPGRPASLTKETHWLSGGTNVAIQYAYDSIGNRIGTIDAKSNTCSSTGYTSKVDYDTLYRTFSVMETNALCQATSKTYWGINTSLSASTITGAYNIPGLLATVTELNGVRSDSYWDSFGRPKASVIPPDNANYPTTVWNYGLTGAAPSYNFESKRETVGVAGTLDKVTYVDGFNRTIQAKSEAKTASQWTTQDTWYNNRGLTESISVPYMTSSSVFTALDTNQYKTTTLYDAMQRPTRVTNPDNTYHTFDYTPYTVASTDENYFTTTRTYDALKRLISVVEPAGGGTTDYYYDYFDAAGFNYQFIVDAAGNTTQTQIDTLGRTVNSYDADRGWRLYTYDANNNLSTQTDARSQTLTYAYDKLNRIYTKTYPGSGGVITYNYDDATGGTFRIGRLWKVTDLTGSTSFTYDLRGRQTNVGKAIGSSTYTTQYTYDSLNRVATMIYPNNEYVGFLYNSQGLLNSVSYATGYYVSNLDYNAAGQNTSKSLGNGKITTYDYYPDNQRVRNITTPLLQNLTYTYDNIGNVKDISDNLSGGIQNFGYDNLHRLSSASDVSAPAYNYSYSYDAIGNMKTGAGKTFTYPAAGAILQHAPISDSVCSYLYDPNGSTSSRTCGTTLRTFTWDFDNRLSQVKNGNSVIESNSYDYAGVRVMKVEGTTTTLTPFPFYQLVNGAATKYYFANGQRIAEKDSAGVVSYYHSDHLGSSNKVSSSTGAEVKFTQFYPYGATRTETGPKIIAHKYTGQEIDTSTGLYSYGARYYDPATMHFLSADEIIPDVEIPQTLNRFAYANNNPIRNIDPSGHESVTVGVFTPRGGVAGGVGVENGNAFRFLEIGAGGGVMIPNYDPNGRIPGPPIANPSVGGSMLTIAYKVSFALGPISFDGELGYGWNLATGDSGRYRRDPTSAGLTYTPDIWKEPLKSWKKPAFDQNVGLQLTQYFGTGQIAANRDASAGLPPVGTSWTVTNSYTDGFGGVWSSDGTFRDMSNTTKYRNAYTDPFGGVWLNTPPAPASSSSSCFGAWGCSNPFATGSDSYTDPFGGVWLNYDPHVTSP
ncbi:MAG: VCBS repeat-containing protein [Gammaproteobacteria bacterium]|nr:VCBS repeat-containing protein [Gammaproteobacteria bacterium]